MSLLVNVADSSKSPLGIGFDANERTIQTTKTIFLKELFDRKLKAATPELKRLNHGFEHGCPGSIEKKKKNKPSYLKIAPCPLDARPEHQFSLITKEGVKKAIGILEDAESYRYIHRYDHEYPHQSVYKVLKDMHLGKKIEIVSVEEGITDAKVVKVDEVSKYVLKKVSLPRNFIEGHWKDVLIRLELSQEDTLMGRVKSVFFEEPSQIFFQEYPYVNYAQREKIAYIFGASLGVPKVQVIKANDGTFSLHDFVKNSGSTQPLFSDICQGQIKVSLQDLQNIGVLDILIENQDRNPSNILVIPENSAVCLRLGLLRLVPIDHALSYQYRDFQAALALEVKRPPCWTNWKCANEELTEQTKSSIVSLDEKNLLIKAQQSGIVIDEKIQNALKRNIAFLQKAVSTHSNITLKELYDIFADRYESKSTKKQMEEAI